MPLAALAAIDWPVLLFLLGVLLVGQALVDSGDLGQLSARLLRFNSGDALLAAVLLGSGLSWALLMNDTVAVIGTPLVLALARERGLPGALLLLARAFSAFADLSAWAFPSRCCRR